MLVIGGSTLHWKFSSNMLTLSFSKLAFSMAFFLNRSSIAKFTSVTILTLMPARIHSRGAVQNYLSLFPSPNIQVLTPSQIFILFFWYVFQKKLRLFCSTNGPRITAIEVDWAKCLTQNSLLVFADSSIQNWLQTSPLHLLSANFCYILCKGSYKPNGICIHMWSIRRHCFQVLVDLKFCQWTVWSFCYVIWQEKYECLLTRKMGMLSDKKNWDVIWLEEWESRLIRKMGMSSD